MRRRIQVMACVLLAAAGLWAQTSAKAGANKDTENWRYEIQPAVGQAPQGCALVRVWSYSKNANVATLQAGKNAVHGIIFTGYSASTDGTRLPGRRPLVSDPQTETKHADYFKAFFAENGGYQRYVSFMGNGVPDQVVKVGKEYKVGLMVTVLVDELRKRLETDGIIQPMNELIAGTLPTLMVVPSDQWCTEHGYVTHDYAPDYYTALTSDPQLMQAITQVNALFSDRGFPLKDMQSQLKSLRSQTAEDAMLSSKSGGELQVSPIDQLKQVAHADIWVKIGWTINDVAGGSQQTLSFVLQGIDAYSDKQVAGATGTSKPQYTARAEVPVMLQGAIIGYMNPFCEQLTSYFQQIQKDGRQLTIRIRVFDDFGEDLESEFNGEELNVIIENWVAENALNGKYHLTTATENQMLFENVAVPLKSANGRDIDARAWLRPLQRHLQKQYGITAKLMTKGLGEATLVLGGK